MTEARVHSRQVMVLLLVPAVLAALQWLAGFGYHAPAELTLAQALQKQDVLWIDART